MAARIITINTQAEIDGASISRLVAAEMGFAFHDEDIIETVARRIGVDTAEVRASERLASFFVRLGEVLEIANARELPYATSWIGTIRHRQTLIDVVRELAEQGDCVIGGHASAAILQATGGCFAVLLRADEAMRARRASLREGVSLREAQRRVSRRDRDDAAYLRRAYDFDRDDPKNYSLLLSTAGLSNEAISAAIVGPARDWNPVPQQNAGRPRRPRQTLGVEPTPFLSYPKGGVAV